MAQDVQTKILEIEIKYEAAIAQLGKYRQEIEATRKVQKDLQQAHKDGVISTTEYHRSMAAADQQIKANQQAVSTLTRQIQTQMKVEGEKIGSLKQLRAELSKATQQYDSMSRAERESAAGQELKKKINDITTELKGAEEETQRFYRNVGNYPQAVTGLGKVESKVKDLGKAMLGLAGITSLGALQSKAKEVGTAYADQMGKVQAVTNANAVEFAQMSKEVERLGSTTRYTAQEAGEAMEFLTRNGLNAVNATGTLEGVLHLAQANAIELAEAADIVTGQMNAFHLSVGDVTHINDVLSYTCANSATNILQLNEALRNTAPIAYTAGVGIEETCAALATLADNNIKGADSGTILKQTFNGMLTSTAKSKAAYDALGISMDISTVKADGFIGSLKKIMDASPSVQQLSDIFGRRAVPGVLALTNSMDLLGEKFKNISENAAGTADRMFEQSYSKFTIAAKSLESAWEGFLIQVWQGTNQQLRDKFVAEGQKIDEEFTPRIEALKEKVRELNGEFAQDPNNDALLEEINRTNSELGNASREYALSKQLLSEQMEVENTGNEALIAQWTQGAQAIDQQFTPQIEKLKGEISTLSDAFKADPTNEEIGKQLEAKTAELNGAIEAYAGEREAFQETMSEEIEASTDTGLAGALKGPIDMLTEGLQYVKENISELGTLLMSIIAGISLAALVKHVKTSATTMKTDLIANAQAATQQVNNLATKESMQRRQVERLKVQYEQASGEERKLIANKLTVAKTQLADTEKQLTKAKTAEISAMENAAAASTATGWKAAMLSAKLAVQGFVTASKTALKSFALTAILSLVIELLMKLWDALNSGEGVIGKIGASIGSFIKNALQKLMQVMVDVINWFIEFYNDSIVVRGAIALLGGIFKAVWALLKAGIDAIGNHFKLLGGIISGVAKALKGLFTLNFDEAIAGIKQIGTAVTDFYKNQVNTAVNAGQEIADGFVNSFKDVNKKLDKVQLNTPSVGDKPTGSGGGTSSVNNGGGGGGTIEDPSGFGSGGGNGKGKGNDKAEQERRKREKLEMEALANLQNELYKIEEDGAEKRRKAVEAEYDKRIAKLRTQLATEKNLTETARKAICDLILVLEQEKEDALIKLSQEETKRVLEEEIKNNEAKLKLVIKGSEEELNLRLEILKKKHDIDVQEMQNAIDIEQRKIDKLKEIDQARYDAMSDDEKAAYDRQLQEAEDALARKQEALNIANQQYARDEAGIREENAAASLAQQKQILQTQIDEMENAETERLLRLQAGHEMTDEEFEAHQQRQLEAIGGFQAQKLEMEEQAAQDDYERLIERGQLSTQTQEEFDAEVAKSKETWLAKQKAINDAYVKQEEAKYQAMKSLTSSLTGLLDTLGENNKSFALMSKVITLAQIAIDTGRAISAGVASASAMPFPSNLAAIATTVATVIANVTTAISTVKSAKFAEGGKVNGPGTGTSDSVPAMLSNGEFVMTAAATRMFEPLLSVMNGIGSGVPMQVVSTGRDAAIAETLTESFSTAAQEIHPVVSVVEINETAKRVKVIENLDNY